MKLLSRLGIVAASALAVSSIATVAPPSASAEEFCDGDYACDYAVWGGTDRAKAWVNRWTGNVCVMTLTENTNVAKVYIGGVLHTVDWKSSPGSSCKAYNEGREVSNTIEVRFKSTSPGSDEYTDGQHQFFTWLCSGGCPLTD